MVYMYHSFLIHSSADGHLGCFHVLAMINSAAMDTGVHVSLSDLVSSVCMLRSGIAGSYGSSSGKLISGCDPPSQCQPSRIPGSLWLEAGGLFAVWSRCRLWGRVCPFPLPSASCLWRGWAGPPLLALFWNSLSPSFWEGVGSV